MDNLIQKYFICSDKKEENQEDLPVETMKFVPIFSFKKLS